MQTGSSKYEWERTRKSGGTTSKCLRRKEGGAIECTRRSIFALRHLVKVEQCKQHGTLLVIVNTLLNAPTQVAHLFALDIHGKVR